MDWGLWRESKETRNKAFIYRSGLLLEAEFHAENGVKTQVRYYCPRDIPIRFWSHGQNWFLYSVHPWKPVPIVPKVEKKIGLNGY